MTTVRQVLQSKGAQVWSMPPKATVFRVLELMAEKDVGAVLVVDEAGRPVGIFTERDYARKVVLKGRLSRDVAVGELMSAKVIVIAPDVTLEDCMQIMTARKIRHLPVMEGEQLVGMISIGDVVKHLLADSKFTIQQLERYIVGPSYPGE
jgi:CBS domain-containing protein